MAAPARRTAFFFDLPQDVPVLLPLLEAVRASGDMEATVWHTGRLRDRWPQAFARLQALGVPLRAFNHQLLKLNLVGRLPAAVLVTASESTEPGHYAAHNLTRAANRRGIKTITLQHGFENIGLTYRAADTAPVGFAAQRVLLWNSPDALPAWVPDETRRKCHGVGRIVAPPAPGKHDKRAVLVCHNLHWERYDDAYVKDFYVKLEAMVWAHPALAFILRGHPGALRQRAAPDSLLRLPNLRVAADGAIADLLPQVGRVITTPSTIAVDAAQAGLPVAVVAGAIDLPLYSPLPLLRNAADWQSFLAGTIVSDIEAFLNRHLLPGDAAARALARLRV